MSTLSVTLQHSLDNPSHVLVAFIDGEGKTQFDCENCSFETVRLATT